MPLLITGHRSSFTRDHKKPALSGAGLAVHSLIQTISSNAGKSWTQPPARLALVRQVCVAS